MDNPYEPPQGALLDKSGASLTLRPSLGGILFLLALTYVSWMTHWWYREIHAFLNVPSTVLGMIVEATLLASWGCTLVGVRSAGPSTKRVVSVVAGVAAAAVVTVACCWVLMFMRQRPHGLMLPISVIAGMAATAFMLHVSIDPNDRLVRTHLLSTNDNDVENRTGG